MSPEVIDSASSEAGFLFGLDINDESPGYMDILSALKRPAHSMIDASPFSLDYLSTAKEDPETPFFNRLRADLKKARLSRPFALYAIQALRRSRPQPVYMHLTQTTRDFRQPYGKSVLSRYTMLRYHRMWELGRTQSTIDRIAGLALLEDRRLLLTLATAHLSSCIGYHENPKSINQIPSVYEAPKLEIPVTPLKVRVAAVLSYPTPRKTR